MNEVFAFLKEGHGLQPEHRIWVWAILGLCVAGLACLPFLSRLPRKWWRRRRRG